MPTESKTWVNDPRPEFWNVTDNKNPLSKSDFFMNFEGDLKHIEANSSWKREELKGRAINFINRNNFELRGL